MSSYDIGGFLSIISGLGTSGGSTGSSSLSLGGSFSGMTDPTTYGNRFFTTGWDDFASSTNDWKFNTDSGTITIPGIETRGSFGSALGLSLVTVGTMGRAASDRSVDVGTGPITGATFGFSQNDYLDAARTAFTGSFAPDRVGGDAANYNILQEYSRTLQSVTANPAAYNDLANASEGLVNAFASMNEQQINSIADRFVGALGKKAEDNGKFTDNYETFSAAVKGDVVDRLTSVRNVAKSMVDRWWGQEGQDPVGAQEAGKMLTQFGMAMNKGEQIRSAVLAMGFVPGSGVASGEGGTGAAAGKPQVPFVATANINTELLDALIAQGVSRPNAVLIANSTTAIAGDLATWSTEFEAARSAILAPNADRGATGGEGDLSPRASQAVTPSDVLNYERVVARFDDLPVYFDDNGKVHITPSYVEKLVKMEKANLGAQIAVVSASADIAGRGVEMGRKYTGMLGNGNFSGGHLFTANSLMEAGSALRAAGEDLVLVDNNGNVATVESVRQAIASNAKSITNSKGESVAFDSADFFTSGTGAVSKLNNYIEQAKSYASTAPTVMSQLANAVDHGFLYDTNMLTGEKTMNGSNWIQLLLATGGIITPIATMLYQSEQERRATRKNQEYADRVRAEDREFQERLLKLQLASAETQAHIAADSKKAVATGSSRTSVTINSPTQSK